MGRNIRISTAIKAAIITGLFSLAGIYMGHVLENDNDNSESNSDVIIYYVNYEAEGNGRTNLNGEWVEIRNTTDQNIDMTGWQLCDNSNHFFDFPYGFTLDAGQSVVIYTGSGCNTDSALYWERSTPVWNDDIDCAFLIDNKGNTVHSHCWP